MQWRLAKALETLRAQVNSTHPRRDKESDGSIGDASHASRSSDHNPWIEDSGGPNVVSALDLDHDTEGDEASRFDSYAFAEMLRQRKDERIKYVISNRKIFSGSGQDKPAWFWRPYTGSNPHDHHVHISVKSDKAHYDDTRPWEIDGWAQLKDPNIKQPAPVPTTLKVGSKGPDVEKLNKILNVAVEFGPETEKAVKAFQTKHNMLADGIVGPQTWTELNKETK